VVLSVTLVVAVTTPTGIWMGGERVAGSFDYDELAGPKIFELETPSGDCKFAMGFAGHPRVAQTILAVTPPNRYGGSLHWWLTELCDRIHDRAREHGVSRDPSGPDPVHLASSSGCILAIEGRVFLIDSDLSWQETTRGYVVNGGAFETFNGAFEVLLEQMGDPVAAARAAWPFVQRRHRIGDLVDEIVLEAG
jgi:hypothetical protein